MSAPKEPEYYQHFELHMKNGEVIDLYEDYNIPVNEGIVGDFKRGKKKFLEFGDRLFCFYTIPFDQISFIAMTDVKKVV